MDKATIIDHIRRLTAEKGKPPGQDTFHRETGIRKNDWFPCFCMRWSDAITEAGLIPNTFGSGHTVDHLTESYIALIRELKRIPIYGELIRKRQLDSSFPNATSFRKRGGKKYWLKQVSDYCMARSGFDDVLELCTAEELSESTVETAKVAKLLTGYVYLMKSGRHYKIGKTNSVIRRHGELKIQIPIPPKTVHSIETDDPSGVEAYWHRRFADKRGEGEWFDLSPDDVSAFKRWKRLV